MRIAVNTRFLQKDKLEGIGRFTFETLKRLVLNNPDVEFIFCFDRKYDSSFIFADNVKPVVIYPQARHPFLFYLWFQFSLPKFLNGLELDAFLSPDGFIPLNLKTKTIAVIHDLAFEHFPKDIDWLSCQYYKYFFPKFAKRADKILTVSEFSKSDIVKSYSICPSKIDVVYNGVSDSFCGLKLNEKLEIQEKISDGNPYFIYVGSIHPRKNIITLLKAFENLKSKNNVPHKLVLVGRMAWETSKEKAFIKSMRFENEVILCGKVEDLYMAQLISAATALVYPSYFEGFGLPVLESFACGVPVITTKNTSMQEIAEDAAYLFNALNVFELEDAMLKLAHGTEDVLAKIEKGKAIAQKYSWDNVADKTWKSILKTIA